MPPALKALLAQILGWLIALALTRYGVLPANIGHVVIAQGIAAAGTAMLMKSAPWWPAIHLVFSPLLIGAQSFGIPAEWYLVAFILLTLVFWTSFGSQVPLYLSNGATVSAIMVCMHKYGKGSLLDIGSGTGSVLIPLARARPDCRFAGLESAPGPFMVSKILARGLTNLNFSRADFFKASWSGYDVVYAFLSPVPMTAVWQKAVREMDPDALLISNSFPVPGITPHETLVLDDKRSTHLYIYKPRESSKGDN